MRITNNMIQGNTKGNINSNKILVDHYNTQMTTQKKISRPSEDPVIAIRSLRLSTSLTKLNQYADNNIPDAESWLDVTETALKNMKDILTDIRTQCVNGSTDTLTADDRNTIKNNLEQLADQIYAEGNADYAGRTVFTGYRTTSKLTFETDEENTKYEVDQKFSFEDFEEHRYYYGQITVPDNAQTSYSSDAIGRTEFQRIRFAYSGIDSLDKISFTDGDNNSIGTYNVTSYESEEAWKADGASVADNEIVFLKDTGELLFGKTAYSELKEKEANINVTYTKTGFDEGDARPEYYYDCKNITDSSDPIVFKKEDQVINYDIAAHTSLPINTQACEVFDTSIARDVEELINVVNTATAAHEKVDKIEAMLKEAQYSDETSQKNLKSYLLAAQKEADYADDNLQKTYAQYISNFDGYLHSANLAITNVGSISKRLQMTQTRVENQQTTIEDLKSTNEDRDMSDIIIDYYASYNAYTASLTAASKIGQQTLLNYL